MYLETVGSTDCTRVFRGEISDSVSTNNKNRVIFLIIQHIWRPNLVSQPEVEVVRLRKFGQNGNKNR